MNLAIFDALERKLLHLPMEGVVERAADRQEDLMISLNVEQMNQGINADGTPITRIGAGYYPYAPSTVRQKLKKGQPVDRVTLHDTGDFQNAERVKRYPGKFELYSQDAKEEQLLQDYGLKIHGLTDQHLSLVREAMLPAMQHDVRNVLATNLI